MAGTRAEQQQIMELLRRIYDGFQEKMGVREGVTDGELDAEILSRRPIINQDEGLPIMVFHKKVRSWWGDIVNAGNAYIGIDDAKYLGIVRNSIDGLKQFIIDQEFDHIRAQDLTLDENEEEDYQKWYDILRGLHHLFTSDLIKPIAPYDIGQILGW